MSACVAATGDFDFNQTSADRSFLCSLPEAEIRGILSGERATVILYGTRVRYTCGMMCHSGSPESICCSCAGPYEWADQ